MRSAAALADHLTFATASAHLGISQSSLSRQITEAEGALGHRLFQRGWNGTEPTSSGAIVIDHARRMMACLATAQDNLLALGARPGELGHHLTWFMLDVVAAVAETGGASPAARQMGTSQPTISRTLAQVAAATGRRPFVRSAGGLSAAPSVAALLTLRDRLCVEVVAMAQAVEALTGEVTGRVAVGLLPFSEQDIVVRAFALLLERYPHLRLQAVTGSYTALTDGLRRGEIDVIVGPLRGADAAESLEEKALLDEWLTIVARPDHPRVNQDTKLSDMIRETWVVGPHGTPTRQFLDALLLARGLTPPLQICEMVTFPLAEKMVLESDAIALLTYSTKKRAGVRDRLAVLSAGLPETVRPIGITTRRGGPSVTLQQLFIDAMVKAIHRQ